MTLNWCCYSVVLTLCALQFYYFVGRLLHYQFLWNVLITLSTVFTWSVSTVAHTYIRSFLFLQRPNGKGNFKAYRVAQQQKHRHWFHTNERVDGGRNLCSFQSNEAQYSDLQKERDKLILETDVFAVYAFFIWYRSVYSRPLFCISYHVTRWDMLIRH